MSQPRTKFLWFGCTLKRQKDEENVLLLDSDGKATSVTKIAGIILEVFWRRISIDRGLWS